MAHQIKRILPALALAIALAAPTTLLISQTASATELSETRSKIEEVQAQIDEISEPLEKALDAYNAALDDKEAAEARQSEIQERIDELEGSVADNRAELSKRAKWSYMNGGMDLLTVLLSAEDFSDFVDGFAYLDSMNRGDLAAVEAISDEKDELEAEYAELAEKTIAAEEAEAEAQEIKDSVQGDLDELQEILDGLEADEREQLGYVDGINYTADVKMPANGSVVDYALSRKGCPYVWGASGPNSFDCSGLVVWSYAQVGISLPHNSEALYAAADAVIPISQAQPGDVLYRSGHVGICTEAGGKKYVHAPNSGAVVRDTDSISWSGFTCALRFYS